MSLVVAGLYIRHATIDLIILSPKIKKTTCHLLCFHTEQIVQFYCF